jgi:hypothetical protein
MEVTVATDCIWYQKPTADQDTKEWFNTEMESGRAPQGLPTFLEGVAKNNDAHSEFCGGGPTPEE